MSMTVIQHVLTRLREIGVSDVFGVPGDFSFPVNDALCTGPGPRWIGSHAAIRTAFTTSTRLLS